MNILYTCSLCRKEFKRKWDLKRHLSRKKTCKKVIQNIPIYPEISQAHPKKSHIIPYYPTSDESRETNEKRFSCDFCNNLYKHKYHLNRHLKTCKEKKKEDEKQEFDLINAKIELLKLEKNIINNTTNNNCSTTNNTNNTNNTNTNSHNTNNTFNLVYNDYGNEDMKFLKSSEKYKKILNNFLGNGMSGLQQYIKYKYCNPEQPQNLTIKYSNQRSNQVKVRNANKWKSIDKKQVMDELYDRDTNVEEILQIYEQMNDLVDNENMDEIQVNFLNDVDELYNDEEQIELKKLKTSTLTDFYNCYKSNQTEFKEIRP